MAATLRDKPGEDLEADAVHGELQEGGLALVVEVPAPAKPFAGWFARLVDGGFGVALGGAGGTGAFRRHLACP